MKTCFFIVSSQRDGNETLLPNKENVRRAYNKHRYLFLWNRGPHPLLVILLLLLLAGPGLGLLPPHLLVLLLPVLHVHIQRHLQVLAACLQQVGRQAPIQTCIANR